MALRVCRAALRRDALPLQLDGGIVVDLYRTDFRRVGRSDFVVPGLLGRGDVGASQGIHGCRYRNRYQPGRRFGNHLSVRNWLDKDIDRKPRCWALFLLGSSFGGQRGHASHESRTGKIRQGAHARSRLRRLSVVFRTMKVI